MLARTNEGPTLEKVSIDTFLGDVKYQDVSDGYFTRGPSMQSKVR
jgi:hypothetical protein